MWTFINSKHLRKGVKIAIFSSALIVLALLGLWLLRNYILINSFQKITEEKTNHHVHLTLSKLNFNPGTMSVTADSIQITFDSVFIDESNNTLLEKLTFSSVQLENFNVWSLLFDKQLKADKLIFTKPDVYITANKADTAVKINPEEVIRLVNGTSGFHISFPAKLKKVEIRYGAIDVTDRHNSAKKFSTGSLTVYMEDFNTIDNNSEQRLNSLSKTLYIKAEDLYKSFQSNYALAIDSLIWHSEKNRFKAFGFDFLPTTRVADTAGMLIIKAGSLTADEFHLLGDTLQQATIQKLVLTNGNLHIRKKKSNGKKTVATPEDFFFKYVTADTLILKHNDLFLETNRGDTVLFFKNLAVNLKNIQIDSLFLKNPNQHFNYKSFSFSTRSFVSNTLLPGLHLESGKVLYNSKRKKFVLDGFLIRDSASNFHFHSGRIKLNLSLKKLLKNQKQTFDVFMIRPYAQVRLNNHKTGFQNDSSGIVTKLIPREVKITGGTFITLLNNGADSLILNNTNLLVKNPLFNADSRQFKWDTLNLVTGKFSFFKQNNFIVQAGSTRLNGNNLTVYNTLFNSLSNPSNKTSLNGLRLKSFNLNKLIFNKELSADSLIIIAPETEWNLSKKNKAQQDSAFVLSKTVTNAEHNTSFKVDIQHFAVEHGKIKVASIKPSALASFESDYSLTWNHLRTGHLADHPFSSLKELELSLSNTIITSAGLKATIGNLHLASDNGFLGFNNIKINSLSDSVLNINDFSINFIGFKAMDYNNLLGQDKLTFGHLLVKGVKIDVEQKQHNLSKKITAGNKPTSIDVNTLLPFETTFDTIRIENIGIRYAVEENQSQSVYSINNFNLKYIPLAKQNDTIVTGIPFINNSIFHFDSATFSNADKGFSVITKKAAFNTYDSTFVLQNITINTGNRTRIESGLISMSGITASDVFPLTFSVKRLNVSKTEMKIINPRPQHRVQEKQQSSGFSGLHKYSELISSFTIDTILFPNISATYYTGDSLKKQWSAEKIKVKIGGFLINPSKALDTLPIQFSSLSADMNNRKFITGDSLYEISAGHFLYNHLEQSLVVDSFNVKPLFDTLTFFEKSRWQTDRTNLFIPQIIFSGIKLDELNKNNPFHLSKVIAKGFHADLYRDKAFPRDSLIRPLLVGTLKKINQPFVIDTLLITNGYFKYSEKEKISDKAGYVFFNGLNLTGINVTNITNKTQGMLTKFFADGKLMGTGKVHVDFYFPLSDNQLSQFWFTGKSEKLDLTTLNTMTQPNAGLTILSGRGTLDIPLVTANDTVAMGNMMFKYRRLKVGLYNRKKANHNGGITTPLVRFILNGLVLRSNNPNWFKRPRVGIVYFKRDRNKSIANYIWKSTLSGALSTLGFNNKEQRKRRKEYRKEEFEVQREAVKNEKYGK